MDGAVFLHGQAAVVIVGGKGNEEAADGVREADEGREPDRGEAPAVADLASGLLALYFLRLCGFCGFDWFGFRSGHVEYLDADEGVEGDGYRRSGGRRFVLVLA